jgi:hypothetical protein
MQCDVSFSLSDVGEVLNGTREHHQENGRHNMVPDHVVPLWWLHYLCVPATKQLQFKTVYRHIQNTCRDILLCVGKKAGGSYCLTVGVLSPYRQCCIGPAAESEITYNIYETSFFSSPSPPCTSLDPFDLPVCVLLSEYRCTFPECEPQLLARSSHNK